MNSRRKNVGYAMRHLILGLVFLFALTGCTSQEQAVDSRETPTSKTVVEQAVPELPKNLPKLPPGLEWLTNDSDPVFSSDKARKGGMYRAALGSFPMTFRVVGPDANGSFRSAILDNQLSLINIHPNTRNILPELATHWAFGADKKTMFFKLNPRARWSDGVPVTARDYAYTLEFMRSEHIIAPWYNDYYSKEIESVTIYDDYTIGITSTKAVPDLYLKLGISPIPRHFYHPLNKDFVSEYNWAIVPNTGAYQISEFKKGRYILFQRKENWWAKNNRYLKNRFNVDRVRYSVIRDPNLQWEYFKKGRLDAFNLTQPKFWHDKSKHRVFKRGYVNKIWFFNDVQRPSHGLWLNQDKALFKDRELRLAFAHGMNVDKVIQQVLRGDYDRLAQPFYGYGAYTDYSIKARSFSIDKVEEIMTAKGWKRGKDGIWANGKQRFSVNLTYGYENHMPQLVVLKEEALKAGIELRLERLDPSAMFKKFLEKQHDVAWMGWSTNLRPSYWQGWHSDNAHEPQTNNITNTDDPELDALIDKYRASLDEEERIALSLKIQAKIHHIAAYVPTYMVPYCRAAYWRWLQLPGFHGTRMSDAMFDPFSSTLGGLFWIDSQVRRQTIEAMEDEQEFPPVISKDTRYRSGGNQ